MGSPSTKTKTALFLWFRLSALCILALVFCEVLLLSQGKAQGWTYYLTGAEVAFEVWVRVVAAALAGMALATLCTVVLFPVAAFSRSSNQLANAITKIAAFVILFLVSLYALRSLIRWSYRLVEHEAIYDKLLFLALVAAFVTAFISPKVRTMFSSTLDDSLTPTVSRRTALVTIGGAAALVATEFAMRKALPVAQAVAVQKKPSPNFLLITFDALCAEDLSLYGCKLETSPNLDRFARNSTAFTRFYSSSTFTTPAVATILTGLYPSESGVYHLQGNIRAPKERTSLPQLLRDRGYVTGAFVTNPYAYYFTKSMEQGFDLLPEPEFPTGKLQHLWQLTEALHQDTGFGSRIDEYVDLEQIWGELVGVPSNLSIRYRPQATFEQCHRMLTAMPDGHFLWVHVSTPHFPYLPDAVDQNRFIPQRQVQQFAAEPGERWQPHYPPTSQAQVSLRRLAYDEFIATADRAFGKFMDALEASGALKNTVVMISSDHGESFEGGVFQHRSPYLTRPVVHIPLIIRIPGQQRGSIVHVTADQSSLPRTILELADIPAPAEMKSPSLVSWLDRNDEGKGNGLAFTQFFDRNSTFKPITVGSVGAIDSKFECVVYVNDQRCQLRPLEHAESWELDRSTEFPAQTAYLRQALHTRFPNLVL